MRKNNKKSTTNTVTKQSVITKPHIEETESVDLDKNSIRIKKLSVEFKSESQKKLWDLIDSKEITIVAGSAGTGKTHISILKALDLMSKFPDKYKKIILTTPAHEADEKLGYLPGTIDEKLDPYIYSMKYIFCKILGPQKTDRMFERDHIKVLPMGFLRGVNIDGSILICDEFQNCTPKQAKTLLTRIGENSKFILNGDYSQSDRYNDYKNSGLFVSMEKLKNMCEIGIFEFSDKDIIRNPIIAKILKHFNGDI